MTRCPVRRPDPAAGPASDRGSAGLWVVAFATVLLTVTIGVLSWSGALVARQRAQSAADLAALAAARHTARGSDACAAAVRVVRASGARLVRCAVDDTSAVLGVVEVEVEVEVPAGSRLGVPPARARARAGPSG